MSRTTLPFLAFGLLATLGLALAQDPPDENSAPPSPQLQQERTPASGGGWRKMGEPSAPPQAEANPPASSGAIPPRLTMQAGTFLTVRVDQMLSTDRNEVGDTFSATLVQPVVVDGIVVAQRGQTVGGRVAEVEKGGRIRGVSKLGIQLTSLALVDGQQVPLQAQLIGRKAPTSVGRDAGAIATTTGMGAAIGGAAEGGVGAGVGAAAGGAAGLIGVLLTRGHPAIVYPETVLSFRIDAPITISTERAPLAFRIVNPDDYQRPAMEQRAPAPRPRPHYAYGWPYPYYYPYYSPYSYWGPGFGLYYGFGGYGFGGYRGRGYHRR